MLAKRGDEEQFSVNDTAAFCDFTASMGFNVSSVNRMQIDSEEENYRSHVCRMRGTTGGSRKKQVDFDSELIHELIRIEWIPT